MQNARTWTAALLMALMLSSSSVLAQRKDAGGGEQPLRQLNAGNGLLQRGLHELAAVEYEQFLKDHADHPQALTARYGLGVALFRLDKPAQAARELTPASQADSFEFSAEATLLLAHCRLRLDQPAAATAVLRDFLARRSEHALASEAIALLAEVHYQQGEFAQAVAVVDRLTAKSPTDAASGRARLIAALAAAGQQDWKQAAARAAELRRLHPDGEFIAQVELLLAQALDQGGDTDAARRAYEAVLTRGDARYVAEARLGLAASLLQNSDPQGALGQLNLERSEWDDSARCRALLLRARALLDLDRAADALLALREPPASCASLQAEFAYWRAKASLRSGDAAAAAQILAAAVQNPGGGALQAALEYDRAVALAVAGQRREAIVAFEQFLDTHKDHALAADATLLLAGQLHAEGAWEKSLTLCERRRSLAPTPSADLDFLVAENLLFLRRTDTAAKAYQAFVEQHPDDQRVALAELRLGAALLQQNDRAGALAPLERAARRAEATPELAEAWRLLAELEIAEQRWQPAAAWLERYVKQPQVPARDDALFKLGISLARQNQHENAVQALERMLKEFPDSPLRAHAHLERGQALVKLDQPAEAVKSFEQALASEPSESIRDAANQNLAALAMQRGDFDAAAARYASLSKDSDDAQIGQCEALLAAKKYADAEAAARAALANGGDRARIGPILVTALARQGEAAAALEECPQIEVLSALPPAEKAGLLYEKAWCLRKLERPDDALTAYDAILALPSSPQQTFAAVESAELLASSGRCEAALPRLRSVLADESTPSDLRARASYRLGACLLEAGDHAGAVDLLMPLAEADSGPLSVSAAFLAGEASLRSGKARQAARLLERVTAANQTDSAYPAALLSLGQAYADNQDWLRSETTFERYLAEFPAGESLATAYFGQGWARENLDRFEDAITAYRKAAEGDTGKTGARAQFQIGECLFALKRYDSAIAELLKVDILYADPEWSAAALYEAGRCCEQIGKPDEARQQFESVIKRFKDSRWATMAAQRLAALQPESTPGRGR